ncbi:MAG: cytochrome P450 [Sphingomonadaceae bacterium]|nr:cytochrome P450 [Sphingomonadaceae bacterium]
MSQFVPPYPPRHARPLSPAKLLQLGARNFLAIWEDKAFEQQLMSMRLLSRRIFICNSPDTVRHAFVTHNDAFERKSPQMRHALKPLLGDGLFISDGETWQRRRRIVSPVIHASRIGEFAPIMVETAAEAAARWSALPEGMEIDALKEMAKLTAEIICRTIFGRQLGSEHADEIVEGFSDYQRQIGQIDITSLIGLPDWMPRVHLPGIRRSVKRIVTVLDEIIASYRAQDPANREIAVIRRLIEARDQVTGEPLDAEALRNEAAVIFMAGHETTANTLAWAWYLLSQAPDVEQRLHAELDATLGGRAPTLEDVPRLVYTRAVIEETLRLYPPVPLLAREAVKDETLRRREVKRGSLIIVVPWLLHRHRLLWDDPDCFDPDRFLPDAPRQPDKYAYVPFSTGPRVCAGLAFGLTEAILCLAALAQRFSLRLRPGALVEPVCRLTLRPGGDGLPMTLHARAGAAHWPGAAPVEAAAPPPGGCPFATP